MLVKDSTIFYLIIPNNLIIHDTRFQFTTKSLTKDDVEDDFDETEMLRIKDFLEEAVSVVLGT